MVSCEIIIQKAKNIRLKSKNGGKVFVRYYLPTGDNKRIQVNTQEIIIPPSESHHNNDDDDVIIWNQDFSLECQSGSEEDTIKSLMTQQSVVFEVRWRHIKQTRWKTTKSQLLGRGEIQWKRVLESPDMELDKWVEMMVPRNRDDRSCKVVDDHVELCPSLQVSMKIVGVEEKNMKKRTSWVGDCNSCVDYEMLALVGAFEGL